MLRRLILMVFPLLLCLSLAAGTAGAGEFRAVGVKNGQLRATPTPFGKILATPKFGERVEELETVDAWQRVRYGKTEGWMHGTLLSARGTSLSAGRGSADSTASSEDLTLAGKGFNAQVESAYSQQNSSLDYATINRMESLVAAPKQMSSFLADGGVLPKGGGQ